jgi:hypothetical protein
MGYHIRLVRAASKEKSESAPDPSTGSTESFNYGTTTGTALDPKTTNECAREAEEAIEESVRSSAQDDR